MMAYSFKRNKLIVVATAEISVKTPKTGCPVGYLVASHPAVSNAKIMGSIERMRAIFNFKQITSIMTLFHDITDISEIYIYLSDT